MIHPDYYFRSVVGITPEFLRERGITALLLDVDNTLCKDEDPDMAPGVRDWLDTMRSHGIKMCIVSNNRHERVQPVAAALCLQFVHKSAKPSRKGITKAAGLLGAQLSQCAMVGDQIFTDIAAANRAGVMAILVHPVSKHEITTIRIKRFFEKAFIKNYFRRGGTLS